MRVQLYDNNNKPTVRGNITDIDHIGTPNLIIELDGGDVKKVNFNKHQYHNSFFNGNRVTVQVHEGEETFQVKLFTKVQPH